MTCHGCGDKGHIRPNCPKNPLRFKSKDSQPQELQIGFCLEDRNNYAKYMTTGTVNGAKVSTMLRDTGCSGIIVSDVDVSSCKRVRESDYLGRVDMFPKVKCYLRCPYFEGWTDAIRAPIKFRSVLVGNAPGLKGTEEDHSLDSVPSPSQPTHKFCQVQDEANIDEGIDRAQLVQTRSSKSRRFHPLVTPSVESLRINPNQFADLQHSCTTLTSIRDISKSDTIEETRAGNRFKYEVIEGLLYRKCI